MEVRDKKYFGQLKYNGTDQMVLSRRDLVMALFRTTYID